MVSAYHVYLEKLYNVEELGHQTNSNNYVIDDQLESAVHLNDVCFRYIDSETKTFEKINISSEPFVVQRFCVILQQCLYGRCQFA